MRTQQYPSDLTDEQWALVQSLIPVYPGGRPRKTSMRDVLDAIFSILRTGCQWRFLPKDFPPKSTVWGSFDEGRQNGTLEEIPDRLRDRVRKQEKPGRPRRSARIDSQSVDTSEGGEARGRDNAQKVDGRKRRIVVDSLGLLLAVVVTAADVDDAAAAPEALRPVGGAALGQGAKGLCRQQGPQSCPLWLGRGERLVQGGGDPAAQGLRRLGQVADPLSRWNGRSPGGTAVGA